MGDSLKIRLTSPPLDNRANDELIEFLSKKLGIPRRDIEILHGEKSRKKKVLVTGINPEDAREKLSL